MLAGGYALRTLYSSSCDLSIVDCSLVLSDSDPEIELECWRWRGGEAGGEDGGM